MTSIDTTLAQRGSRYGIFAVHAEHTQALKDLLRKLMGQGKWDSLHQDQKEALEMIAHKLGRITNGDPNYDDSWRDIAGYAQLVANRLAGQVEQTEPAPVQDVGQPKPEEPAKECAECATPPAFKIGDRVRIASDKAKTKALCRESSAGWLPEMALMCGMHGQVVELSTTNTARVKVLGADYSCWWALKCLEKLEDKAEDELPVCKPS